MHVEAFTDGACSGNPGPGGWGVVLRWNSHEKELRGAARETTNNRMELQAAIEALNSLKRKCDVTLVTDSQYVKNGITQWIHGWRKNGWKTAGKKPVKNADLWQELSKACERHDVTWEWVRGHMGHPENERADALARKAIEELRAGA